MTCHSKPVQHPHNSFQPEERVKDTIEKNKDSKGKIGQGWGRGKGWDQRERQAEKGREGTSEDILLRQEARC